MQRLRRELYTLSKVHLSTQNLVNICEAISLAAACVVYSEARESFLIDEKEERDVEGEKMENVRVIRSC